MVLADSVIRYDITASPKNANDFKRTDDNKVTTSVSVFKAVGEIAAITKQDPSTLLLAVTTGSHIGLHRADQERGHRDIVHQHVRDQVQTIPSPLLPLD